MNISIIGASGFTGIELLRILQSHPQCDITYVTSETYAGKRVADLYPSYEGSGDLRFSKYDLGLIADNSDLVFLAVPHGESMDFVPGLLESGVKVIDLSGDFRFSDAGIYEHWYGLEHKAQTYLQEAVYGLPEINRERIAHARLVANPGCYPTAAILGILPAIVNDVIVKDSIIIDAKSGVSGAGRSANEKTHYVRRNDSITAYAIATHKHTPEIETQLSSVCGAEIKVSFTPHLTPMSRGILATIYAQLSKPLTQNEAADIYISHYTREPFIKVLSPPAIPETGFVRGSNMAQIGVTVDERVGRLVIVAAIDNLVKGASGQAIQNLNIMSGLHETTSLRTIGLYP